ncbi:MAG TPA: cysteine desulfurase family protein [Planctomycetota bacterium]|nr:cysteine desulfurase family protein [Planctomycetota bacterium]
MRQIYLDNHSSTRLDERVLNEMLPYLKDAYGNAQSMHSLGNRSKEALEQARHQTADLINANDDEIYFTSCGSESNNLAVKGAAAAYTSKGKHIIVSTIEHFSVLNSAKRLEQAGFQVTALPVDKYGVISIDDLKQAIRPDTVLVSIQQANPEIGTIQPIEELARIAKAKGILFHTDAVATAGTIPVDVNNLGVDLLTLAGSQFYGPKGAAALYIKKGVRVIPQIDGGVQENGRRAGTENVPAIVGLGKASEIAKAEMAENNKKLIALRDRLVSALPSQMEHIYLNGHPVNRLANNINFSVEFIEGEAMLLFLDSAGIYISSGSSCASKALKMSHVLSAIKVDSAVAQGSVLMTLSKYNSNEDIDYILSEFPPIIKKLRDMSPLYAHFKKTGQRQAAGPGTDYAHAHDHEVCE